MDAVWLFDSIQLISIIWIFIQAARFLEEITNSTIGLTGMRFFFLTRSLILSVAGTVVTYELVLVQFQILSPGRSKRLCGQ